MKESDIEHLRCIYERISTHVRKDNDYMIKFKSIIDELEKENMPETKRWRLEIPENGFNKLQLEEIGNARLSLRYLLDKNGEIYDHEGYIETTTNWPKFLFVEIKEEKTKTAGEWYRHCYVVDESSPKEYENYFKQGFYYGSHKHLW